MKSTARKQVLIAAGLAAGLLLILLITQRFTNPGRSDPALDYYQELSNRCGGDDCCERSARTMADGDFQLASVNGCRLGYQAASLPCENSYRWCEPPKLAE